MFSQLAHPASEAIVCKYAVILKVCLAVLMRVTLAVKLIVYCTDTLAQERPESAVYPSLHLNPHELLNQPCVVNVALDMPVHFEQTPPEALAQPRRYSPTSHVLH